MSNLVVQSTLLFILPILFAYGCFSDLFSMKISNRLCLLLISLFPVFAVAAGMPLSSVGLHFAAGICVLAVSFAFFAFGWIGGGDAKFVAAIAVWIGFSTLWEFLAVSAIFGGVLTLGILMARSIPLPWQLVRFDWITKLHDRKTGVPYGIALSIAGVVLLPNSDVWKTLL